MDSGHCYVVNSGNPAPKPQDLIASLSGEVLDYEFSEYLSLQEELFVLDMTLTDLANEVGYNRNTVYQWKGWGIPAVVKAYMALKLKYEDKVNPEKSIRLA